MEGSTIFKYSLEKTKDRDDLSFNDKVADSSEAGLNRVYFAYVYFNYHRSCQNILLQNK